MPSSLARASLPAHRRLQATTWIGPSAPSGRNTCVFAGPALRTARSDINGACSPISAINSLTPSLSSLFPRCSGASCIKTMSPAPGERTTSCSHTTCSRHRLPDLSCWSQRRRSAKTAGSLRQGRSSATSRRPKPMSCPKPGNTAARPSQLGCFTNLCPQQQEPLESDAGRLGCDTAINEPTECAPNFCQFPLLLLGTMSPSRTTDP